MMGMSLRMDGIVAENDPQGGLDALSRGYIHRSQLAFFGVIQLMEYQPVTLGIVREDVPVPAPIQRRFDLPLYFDVRELLVQEVAEELQRQRVVGLAYQSTVHLLEQGDASQNSLTEESFSRANVGSRERFATGGDRDISTLGFREAQQGCGLYDGQKIVHFRAEFVGELIEVTLAAVAGEQFQQARNCSAARVRQHLVSLWLRRGRRPCLKFRLRQQLVNVIHIYQELRGSARPRVLHRNPKIGANPGGISSQDDNAIRQHHRLFDIVGHEKDTTSRDLLAQPELHQFTTQVLRREHVERGKWLVHEQDFRLNRQGAREPHTLLHATGELLWVGILEAFQTDRIQRVERLPTPFALRHPQSQQWHFDVFGHSQPRKQREALKHNGDVGAGLRHGPAMPQNFAGAGRRQTREHAQERRFARARRPKQRDDDSRLQG